MEKAVIYEVKDSVATITLNRPDRYNAVNQALVDGISDSLNKASNDENVRSVVLTGSGKGFCAGADMSVFGQKATPEQRRDYLIDQYQPLLGKFFDLKKPIIGAINGTAAGVGASFALACDFRVMSSESAILFAFINIGLGPDGGASWLLSRQVGYSKALEIATSGKKVLGDECLELGLTNKIVEKNSILTQAQKWALELAKKCQNISYIKVETSPIATKVFQMVDATKDVLTIFGGAGGSYFIEEMRRGAKGTMPFCSQPKEFVKVWNLFQKGEEGEAINVFNKFIVPMSRLEIQTNDLCYHLHKQFLVKLGVIMTSHVRGPTMLPDPISQSEIDEMIDLMSNK